MSKRSQIVEPTQRVIELPLEPGEQQPGLIAEAPPARPARKAWVSKPVFVDERRPRPYAWVTWLTGLLAGTDQCVWRSWFRTQHKFVKVKETSERRESLAAWTKTHDQMTAYRESVLLGEGYAVSVEDDNAFRFEGRAATLAGKPDLVAIRLDEVLVIDEKSGQPRPSDAWQVRIYQFVLPLANRSLRGGYQMKGLVEYRDGSEEVARPTPGEIAKITDLMKVLGNREKAPARTPSVRECGFCDIANCPDRKAETVAVVDGSEFF